MIPISKPIVEDAEKKAVEEVLSSGMLAMGQRVLELERRFAMYCNTKHAIAVNSGTAAIHTALYAAGVSRDDEVITVPFTFVASANPILMQGAKIVFVDVEPETFTIDVTKVETKISKKTKAIIPVDLYGQTADYTALREIAKKYGLKIIEDACQAHGAKLGGIPAGKLGDLGCFSFYATKNMMSGEGGIITTDNDDYSELCRRFRHHGQSEKTRYEYIDIGYNYRLTDVLAAIALVQMDRIEELTKNRIENAEMLSLGLKDIPGLRTPIVRKDAVHVFHQYTLLCDNKRVVRDKLLAHLKEQGIGAAVYYPKPLHLHPHFKAMGYKQGDFPVSEMLSQSVISIPVHPALSKDEIKLTIKKIRDFCGR